MSPVSGLSYPNFNIYHEDFKSLDSNSLLTHEIFICKILYLQFRGCIKLEFENIINCDKYTYYTKIYSFFEY